jgi:hypothetical protein
MSKEAMYELQKIDCNCNDCGYLIRDLSRPPDRGKPCPINYGHCSRFNKPITFIPVTCQIETQNCFIHRKDFNATTSKETLRRRTEV